MPPYCVVSAECFEEQISGAKLHRWVEDYISRNVFTNPDNLMIRSSGTVERMRDRGSFVSKRCTALSKSSQPSRSYAQRFQGPLTDVSTGSSRRLSARTELVTSRTRGALSENHVTWIVEFEAYEGHPGSVTPIGIRNWRDGRNVSSLDLECGSETEIIPQLRQVAKWGLRFGPRIHFEWVWDGRRLWIVQADAEETANGKNPTSKLPAFLRADTGTLHTFHRAEAADYKNYSKA